MSSAEALMILNLSQESFSDGGQLSSGKLFVQRLQELKKLGFSAFDIGAQSTAPNRTRLIDGEEEYQRFSSIFAEALQIDANLWDQISFLSLDTFRPATFVKIFKWLRASGYKGSMAFNDVSGRYQEGVQEALNAVGEQFTYILCHNRISSREETPFHMNYQHSDKAADVLLEIENFFEDGAQFLQNSFPAQHLIFDPCLGFAKSYQENWQILNNVERFDGRSSIILGISRKSFLRQRVREMIPAVSDSQAMDLSEFYHFEYIKKWTQGCRGHLWVRMHGPNLGLLALGKT